MERYTLAINRQKQTRERFPQWDVNNNLTFKQALGRARKMNKGVSRSFTLSWYIRRNSDAVVIAHSKGV